MTQWLQNVLQDLRYAIRTLARSRGFTLIVLAALALGIGATTAIFTVVNSVLLKPLPFPNPAGLVAIREITPAGVVNPTVQTQNYLDWQSRSRSFERVAALQPIPLNLTGSGDAEQVNGVRVSADFFPLLGIQPTVGRWFTRAEDQPGAPVRVILSYGFWQRRFGADPGVVGKILTLGGATAEIIGALPPGFAVPNLNAELFIAAQINPAMAPRDGRNFQVYSRLRSGVALSAAQGELAALHAQSTAERPQFNTRWTATAVPLLDDAVRDVRTSLLVLLGAVLFVLLLCCVNVANLYMIRTYNRVRELTVRHALGAGRGRILRQLMTESLLLTLVGGLLGIGLAYAGLHGLLALLPANFPLPRLAEIHVDGRVLLACLGTSVAAGIAFGLTPALIADLRNPADALRHAGRAIAGGRHALGNALVVAEVALALVLVCGAGLMGRSFIELNRVNLGFSPEHVLTMRMLLVPFRYGPDIAARASVVERMLEQIRAVPQVSAAASIHFLPMGGIGSGSGAYRADRPEPAPGSMPSAGFSIISDGYFQAMRIPLVAGREFNARDRAGAPMVAIINQAAARMLYPGEDPIGKTLTVIWSGPPQAQIVGVASDSHFEGMRVTPGPFVFLPNAQRPSLITALVIRTSGDPVYLTGAIREALRRVDPDQGVMETATMEERISNSIARPRLQTVLLGAFGILALVLACLGIYGVLTYAVAQRMREFGIRAAMGAAPRKLLGEILSGGLRLAGAGVLIGTMAALALTRYLETLLYAVKPTDAVVFGSAIGILLAISALACYVPARRAASADPLLVLRQE